MIDVWAPQFQGHDALRSTLYNIGQLQLQREQERQLRERQARVDALAAQQYEDERLRQQAADTREAAARKAAGSALQALSGPDVRNYVMRERSTTPGFVPLEDTRAAGDAYQAADRDAAGLRAFAPVAEAGGLSGEEAAMLIQNYQTGERKDRAELAKEQAAAAKADLEERKITEKERADSVKEKALQEKAEAAAATSAWLNVPPEHRAALAARFNKELATPQGKLTAIDFYGTADGQAYVQKYAEDLAATKAKGTKIGAEQGALKADPYAHLSQADRVLAKSLEGPDGKPIDMKLLQQEKDKRMGGKGAPTPFKTFFQGQDNLLLAQGVESAAERARLISDKWFKQNIEAASARGEAYVKTRAKLMPIPVFDSQTGEVRFSTAEKIMTPGGETLGPAAQSDKILMRKTTLKEIKNAVLFTRAALKPMPEFTAAQAVQLAAVFSTENAGKFGTVVKQQLGKTLNPQQIDYAVWIANLQESAMALRQAQPLGQGSDMVRRAIEALIPNAATPNKAYAEKQLDALQNMIDLFDAGIPSLAGQGSVSKGGTQKVGSKKGVGEKKVKGATPSGGRFTITPSR